MDSLHMFYGDSMAYVVYYTGVTHPELVSPGGNARAEWYGVGFFTPLAFFDGTTRAPQVTMPDSFYSVYRDMIEGARVQKAMMEIMVDSCQIDTNRMRVWIHITPTDSSLDTIGELRLVMVVFEDSVPFYSYLREDTVFSPATVRQVLGNGYGVPVRLRFGQEFDTLLTAEVVGYNINRTGIVVFVQSFATRAVYQSVVRWRIRREGRI